MNAPDPRRLAEVVEEYFPTTGRWLIRLVTLFFAFFVMGLGGAAFFGDFVGGIVWPFFSGLFGETEAGITLDNIEAIIIVLVFTIVFFVLVFTIFIVMFGFSLRKRKLSQIAIDEIAGQRDRGITVLNIQPDLNNLPSDPNEKATWLQDWAKNEYEPAHDKWRAETIEVLEKHCTKAEVLSFSRLGVIKEPPFGSALSPLHDHRLKMLSKQLAVLEDLIQRYQERR